MTNETIKVVAANEYNFLNSICKQNGLETMSQDALGSVVRAWQLVDDSGNTQGGVCVLKKDDEFIIDCLGVNEEKRQEGYGRQLVNAAVDYVKQNNGKNVYLITRIPLFFMRIGFNLTNRKNAPDFSECFLCSRYEATCYPEIMHLELS